MNRVGIGYDIHRLVEGRELWIGGIKIDHPLGLDGHSDADVLLHALCDALLGAAALRDIGYHFPDTDPKYKGADSKFLLAEVVKLLAENNYKVGNVDSVLIAQEPRLNPHIPRMVEVISEILGVPERHVSIKASTNEKLGAIGNKEGIVALVTVMLNPLD